MADTQNKNVRMGPGALEVLRALKYDLDESDGTIMEQALRSRAIERLYEHVAEVERLRRGFPGEGGREERLTAAQVLVTALNVAGERYRLQEGGLGVRPEGSVWLDGRAVVEIPSPLYRACLDAASDEARELGCEGIDMVSAALSLTRAGTPGRQVLQAIGVDSDALRAVLLPLATRGTTPMDPPRCVNEDAARALWVEPGAEAYRLRLWLHADRMQPEHVVLSVARMATGKVLMAFESQAATYDLLHLRLTATAPIPPFSPELVAAFARAFEIAREAAWSQLSPDLLLLALAEAGPDATPEADPGALLASLRDCDRCRPKDRPLALDQPVELSETVRIAGNLLGTDQRTLPLAPAAFFPALVQAVFTNHPTGDVPNTVQAARDALEAAGMPGGKG